MTSLSIHRHVSSNHGNSGRREPHKFIDQALTLPFVWLHRHQERQSLLRLNDRLLRDIGISRADVIAESDKPFWRE